MRTGHKVLLIVIALALVLGAIIFFNMRGNNVEAGYMRWAIANNISLFFASPMKFLAGDSASDGNSSPLLYIGIGGIGLVFMLIMLKFTGDGETVALRKRVKELDTAKNEAERALQDQVWKGKTDRQAKESAMRDLESSIDKIEILLNELGEKEKLLKIRESEMISLKTGPSARAGVAPGRGPGNDRMLAEELRKKSEALQARDATIKDLEQRLSTKTSQWENQLREKERQLKGREGELEGQRYQINDLTDQLADMEAARKRTEERFQEEARKRRELIEANEQASKAEEQRLGEQIRLLEGHLIERDKLLKNRDGDINNFRRQHEELAAAKAQAESSLQELLGQSDKWQQAKDVAVRELEQRYGATVQGLKTEVGEKDLLLEVRDGEINSLKSEVNAVAGRLSELAAAKVRAEAALEEALRKEEMRGPTDLASRELEERYSAELTNVANQLREHEELLQTRDAEMAALKSELQSVHGKLTGVNAAKEQIEATLQQEIRKERQQREAREAVNRELEERYVKELDTVANQLREKEEFLYGRDGELTALRSEVKALTGRLNDVTTAKERAEASWQEELRKERQQREAREATNCELENRHASELQNLAKQLGEKDEALKGRDGELLALKTQFASLTEDLAKVESAKERSAALLQDKIRNEKQLRDASDSALKELEENFKGKIAVLEEQVSEKLQTMGSRDSQLQSLTSELTQLNRRLSDMEGAKEKAESLFSEAVREKEELAGSKDASIRELEDNLSNKMRAFETQLSDRDALLKGRDEELTVIKKQLTELGAAKDHATRLLQDDLRKKSDELEERESARKVLEEQLVGQLRSFESQLTEQREQLNGRDAELAGLTAKVGSLAHQLTEAAASKEQTARLLQDEIRKKTEELEQREAHAKALEERFAERLQTLESQLGEQRDQLGNRDAELAGLSAKLGSLTNQLADAGASKDQTTRQLQDEIRKKTEELEQREAHAKALEERFVEQVRSLESDLLEQRERLTGREMELAGLTAKLASLTNQLDDAGSSREETARLLQEEIRKRTSELEEREAHAKALEDRLTERVRSLDGDLDEQRRQLAGRESEVAGLTAKLASLTSQLSIVGASQGEAAQLLQEEAREKAELLQAKEAALKGLEERLSGSLRSLETQLSEKQELLEVRDSEVETLIAKVSSLAGQVADLESARGRIERQLQDDLREKDALLETKNADLDDLEDRLNSRMKTMERQLNDKQKLLESASVEMGDMRAQMSVLEEQLKESENAKTWLENALHEERNKESQALIVADNLQPAVLDDDNAAAENGEADGLDNIRTEREALLKTRDKLINDLMGELKEKKSQLAKHEIEVWQGIERRGVWKHRLSKIGIRLKD